MKLLLSILVIFSIAPACDQESSNRARTSETSKISVSNNSGSVGNFSIVNGYKLPNDGVQFPFVGALVSYDRSGYNFCTGSLLCEKAVLTAAHCKPEKSKYHVFTLDPNPVKALQKLKKASGDNLCKFTDPAYPCRKITSMTGDARFIPDATLMRKKRRWDIAVATLESSINLKYYPKISNTDPASCEVLFAAGYGRSDPEKAGSMGTIDYTLLKYDARAKNSISDGFWGYHSLLRFNVIDGYPSYGDSGGPVFTVSESAAGKVYDRAVIYGVYNQTVSFKRSFHSYYASAADDISFIQNHVGKVCPRWRHD